MGSSLPASSNILTSAVPRQGPEHAGQQAWPPNHSQEGIHRTCTPGGFSPAQIILIISDHASNYSQTLKEASS